MKTIDTTSPAEKRAPVLIIDNYDSFTYNIREQFAKIGVDAVVFRNDEITIEEIQKLNPDYIVISPGPGTPENKEDIGITSDAIDYAVAEKRSLLGVCLGHQALVHHFGGKIVQAGEIVHGKARMIDLDRESRLFKDVGRFPIVQRYHSLAADPGTFPDELQITSLTADKYRTIMACEHREHPLFGVQFHPESFATRDGDKIFRNFLETNPDAFADLLKQGLSFSEFEAEHVALDSTLEELIENLDVRPFTQKEIPCSLSPEQVNTCMGKQSFFSYSFETLGNDRKPDDRYSYFGTYPLFTISAQNQHLYLFAQKGEIAGNDKTEKEIQTAPGVNPFQAVNALVERIRAKRPMNEAAPLDHQYLSGGFVGGMSYESVQYAEPGVLSSETLTPENQKTFTFSYYPDGIVYDNIDKKYYYYTRGEDRFEFFKKLLTDEEDDSAPEIYKNVKGGMSRRKFIEKVTDIRDNNIRKGESFQVVLSKKETYSLSESGGDSLSPVYNELRRIAPSSNMHHVRMRGSESMGSFPELTLKISDELATIKLVAGTAARTGDLAKDAQTFEKLVRDPKEHAEHAMLVDLGRNDLARTSLPGTVSIPENGLMHRLDAGPIMHIASTVQSRVNGNPPLLTMLHVSPMGTVSGAPKVRSMQIINEHEKESRGSYAGTILFVDMRGHCEGVIGLRNIIRNGDTLTIQSGAGIVFDSNSESEFEETEQKKGVAREAIAPFLQ